jgi:pantetheine-phosphate adenylyltransferase
MLTGSFDPVTNGHIDLLCRSRRLFDRVYAAVLVNPDKSGLFSLAERTELLRGAVCGMDIEVVASERTAVEVAKACGADCLVRGIRNAADHEYERVMAAYNYEIGGIDTLFFEAGDKTARVSSGAVKRLLQEGKSVRAYVPEAIFERLNELYSKRTSIVKTKQNTANGIKKE